MTMRISRLGYDAVYYGKSVLIIHRNTASGTLVHIYQTSRRHIQKRVNFNKFCNLHSGIADLSNIHMIHIKN
jgi:hypothetical protein